MYERLRKRHCAQSLGTEDGPTCEQRHNTCTSTVREGRRSQAHRGEERIVERNLAILALVQRHEHARALGAFGRRHLGLQYARLEGKQLSGKGKHPLGTQLRVRDTAHFERTWRT